MNGAEPKPKRTHGAWKPGQSGNPKGRPPNRAVKEFRDALDARSPDAVRVLFEKVDAGEDAALTLFFKLWLVGQKPVTPLTAIPLKRGASIAEAADEVLRQTLAGEISPTVGEELMNMIQGHRMIADFEALKADLAEWKAEKAARGK